MLIAVCNVKAPTAPKFPTPELAPWRLLINFFAPQVQRLFEGGTSSRPIFGRDEETFFF